MSGHRFVLVAIDASPHSLAALESAAKLAARLHAELRGMYVEDINLVRMAELPFASAISSSGESHRLTREDLERQLHRQAEIARRALESAGARSKVVCTFSVVRGAVTHEIVAAASSAEIVTVGRAGWSVRGGTRLGSVVRSLLSEAGVSLLMVEQNGIDGPFSVVYDGSATAGRALELASALAVDHVSPVRIFLIGAGAERKDSVEAELRKRGIPARFETLKGDLMAELASSLRNSGTRTVLLPASVFPEAVQAASLLESLNRTVLLVR